MQEYTPPELSKVEFYATTDGFHPTHETAQKLHNELCEAILKDLPNV